MTFKRTLVFILISINITIAQNINLLDEKNGFKSFKLGEKFDVYKNDLKFIDFNENSDAIYEYTGLDKNLKTLFDLEL